MPSNIFFLILSILIVIMVFTQVRNQKMKEKYAALWLIVSVVIIVLALFPHLLGALADFTGVVVPVNLLFLLAIMMLIGVCLHLTLEISSMADETRALAEEVAILRATQEQGKPAHIRAEPATKTSEPTGSSTDSSPLNTGENNDR